MIFRHPENLWLLLFLVIPILVHLFDFQITRTLYFPTLRFLKGLEKRTGKTRKLRKWLVLLFRCLTIASLVLAAAMPYFPVDRRVKMASAKKAALFLDNSRSTLAQSAEETAPILMQERQEAKNWFSQNQGSQPLWMDFLAEGIWQQSSQFGKDQKNEEGTTQFYDFNGLQQKAKKARVEQLWVFSDFQQHFLQDTAILSQTDGIQLSLVPFTFAAQGNAFVDSLWINREQEGRVALSIKVRNGGSQELKDLNLQIVQGDRLENSLSLDIKADSAVVKTVDISKTRNEAFSGTIVLNDEPVHFDNEFYFTLPQEERIHVLSLYQDKPYRALRSFFQDDEVFTFSTMPVGNVDYAALSQADMIVLNGVQHMPNELLSRLKTGVKPNQWVMVVPAQKDGDWLARLVQAPINQEKSSALIPFQQIKSSNLYFGNIFSEEPSRVDMPKAYKHWNLNNAGTSIIKFIDGTTYCSLIQSHYIVFSSGFADSAQNFSRHPLFAPMLYSIFFHLTKDLTQPLYHRLMAGPVTFTLDTLLASQQVLHLVNKKTSEDFIPEQRMQPGEVTFFLSEHVPNAGSYWVTQQQDTLGEMALNTQRQESVLKQWSLKDLQEVAATHSNVNVWTKDAFKQRFSPKENAAGGMPLWKYFILLALLFILAEIVILRFWTS